MDFRVNIAKAEAIEGWMTANELRWLAEQAVQHSVIIEIGTHHGRSTRALGDHSRGVVYSIDSNLDTLEYRQKNLVDLIEQGRVKLVSDSSRGALMQVPRADMVFIDGDHDYENVKREIYSYSLILRQGGVMSGHDFGVMPGVTQAVQESFTKFSRIGSIWAVRL